MSNFSSLFSDSEFTSSDTDTFDLDSNEDEEDEEQPPQEENTVTVRQGHDEKDFLYRLRKYIKNNSKKVDYSLISLRECASSESNNTNNNNYNYNTNYRDFYIEINEFLYERIFRSVPVQMDDDLNHNNNNNNNNNFGLLDSVNTSANFEKSLSLSTTITIDPNTLLGCWQLAEINSNSSIELGHAFYYYLLSKHKTLRTYFYGIDVEEQTSSLIRMLRQAIVAYTYHHHKTKNNNNNENNNALSRIEREIAEEKEMDALIERKLQKLKDNETIAIDMEDPFVALAYNSGARHRLYGVPSPFFEEMRVTLFTVLPQFVDKHVFKINEKAWEIFWKKLLFYIHLGSESEAGRRLDRLYKEDKMKSLLNYFNLIAESKDGKRSFAAMLLMKCEEDFFLKSRNSIAQKSKKKNSNNNNNNNKVEDEDDEAVLKNTYHLEYSYEKVLKAIKKNIIKNPSHFNTLFLDSFHYIISHLFFSDDLLEKFITQFGLNFYQSFHFHPIHLIYIKNGFLMTCQHFLSDSWNILLERHFSELYMFIMGGFADMDVTAEIKK
ncbi:hypothetical protein ADEAN_001049800 [Angomonas deanei]|uniref:Uncharacterized protein n=1 Tax=Angomonas deanei TaxID=59799 RepID=A0A7G2CXD1_9TRYP|nr:hypothetical protein ADEAN_001049800 [Angomonas deanei]